MRQGVIIKGYGGFYFVQAGQRIYRCRGRGRLKRAGTLLVGDRVLFSVMEEGTGVIEEVLPRRNALKRPPVANVDQAILVFALAEPEPDLNLLDRLLVIGSVEKMGMLICFNKLDLASGELARGLADIYQTAGYEVIFTSALRGEGLTSLKKRIRERVAVVAGPSGAGKSTLINALEPGMSLKTGEISARLKRGRHTTRHVELFPVAGGLIADTPGFSNLALPDISKRELAACFPEINQWAGACRFLDCLHLREPDCAVKAALEEGSINRSRYQNYVNFLREVMARERVYE